MKKKAFQLLFLILTVLICFNPFSVLAEENGLNLISVPPRLLGSLPPAIFSGVNSGFDDLPTKVDVGSHLVIPRSQGSLGSCASWCVAAELTRAERLRNNWQPGLNRTFFSPLYLYSQCNGGRDQGSSLYDNLNLLVTKGCSLYVTFPYVEEYRIQPPLSAHREAARYRIEEFKNIPVDLDAMRRALAKGYGLIVSFRVYENFDTYKGGVYRPGGQSGVERRGSRSYSHGMTIFAYNDDNRLFYVCNSWGPNWGSNGYLYFSYDDLHSLISECYIMIPKASLPTTAVPPSHVQATKGSHRNKIVLTWENNGADEYEVFRLGDNEFYNSLGKTKTPRNSFEDTNVISDKHYFYFVASHKGEYMSELSMGTEGWTNGNAVKVPGIPSEFSVRRQGNSVIAQWTAVENADSYQVYQFDNAIGEYILIGETTRTVLQIPLPEKIGGPVITYIVLGKNNGQRGLPSEPAALVVDEWSTDQKEEEHRENREIYRGSFYNFSHLRFMEIELQARELFKQRKDEYQQRSTSIRNQAATNFMNLRDEFNNKTQDFNNRRFQGGR